MIRSTAREIAVHLILDAEYTKEPTEQVLETRFDADYYSCLAEENEVYAERPNKKQMDYITQVVNGVVAEKEELDDIIAQFSTGWRPERISRLSRAILETAIYEIRSVKDVPTGVAINEAVNLVKKYEDEPLAKFVNGILGSYARSLEQ